MIEFVILWFWGAFAIVVDRLHGAWYGDSFEIAGASEWAALAAVAVFWPLLPLIQIALIISDKWKQK